MKPGDTMVIEPQSGDTSAKRARAIAAAIVPMGRGARSLVWSRVGDVFEWLAVVLALPAGLLAADTIGVLRGVMGG